MVIKNNPLASYTSRQLGINEKKLKISVEKLSSGYKINRAADDAAGLGISEKMRMQIRGLDQGTENMQDGVSWVQIGDGAMEEIQDILHRMTELAVKGANGTLSVSDREAIDSEMRQLKVEINRINETTKFNDMRIFSTEYVRQEDSVEFTIIDLTGEIDDLDIFNASYDNATGKVTYGGIVFYGNRVSWNKIAPDMVYTDGDVQRFHAGTWKYTDAQGRKLTFSANEGDAVPKITRSFNISADSKGIFIDGELIEWGNVKNEAGETVEGAGYVNGIWTAEYHGMTMKFEIDKAYNGFSGMIEAINNGHDDKYRYKVYAQYTDSMPVKAVDADISVNDIRISEDIAKKIAAGEKYFLGADETGLWLESYDPVQDTKNKITGSEKTWAEMGISSWNEGGDIKADYSYSYSDDDGVNDTNISFSYTLSDITSVDSVIDGLDGIPILYQNARNNYQSELELDLNGSNVISAELTDKKAISLEDELALGRDFEVKDYKVGTSSLEYDPAKSTISLSYADASGNNVITFEGQDTAIKQQMLDGLKSYEEMLIRKAIMTKFFGYDLEPKDLKDYLGPGKITTSGKLSETVTLDSTMIRSPGSSSSSALKDGETYGCGRVDFSGIKTQRDIWELTGSGFDSTCNTCSRHYSFKFVLDAWGGDEVDGVRYRIDKTDSMNPVMEVSVSSLIEKGIAGSADPGQEIAEALTKIAAKGFAYHYQQYAAKDGVFYVLDERPEYKGTNVTAQFYTTPYNTNMDYREEYTLNLDSQANGSQSIKYLYDHSDYEDRISVEMERDDVNGKYVLDAATGLYEDAALHPGATEKYNIKVSYKDAGGNVDNSVTGTKTIMVEGQAVTVKTAGDIGGDDYATDAVKNMVNATKVKLEAKDYTKADRVGDENPNIAIDSFYNAFFAATSYHELVKMPETIRIQKSGDVPNYLTIPKFALNTSVLGLRKASCLTSDSSRNTIDMISDALEYVSSKRSTFGALQNRMEHAINSNKNVSENTTAAESRTRDTDMAKEMIAFSNNQIVSQAIQAMLAQANQSGQAVLGLLGRRESALQ